MHVSCHVCCVHVRARVCVCVCVCARARARVLSYTNCGPPCWSIRCPGNPDNAYSLLFSMPLPPSVVPLKQFSYPLSPEHTLSH